MTQPATTGLVTLMFQNCWSRLQVHKGSCADVLPVFRVALLEAGGRPLLSPPNAPHLVLTLQDCVMVEERKVGKLFLDEVVYFLHRAALWTAPPILYPFVSDMCKSGEGVSTAVDFLLHVLDERQEEAGNKGEVIAHSQAPQLLGYGLMDRNDTCCGQAQDASAGSVCSSTPRRQQHRVSAPTLGGSVYQPEQPPPLTRGMAESETPVDGELASSMPQLPHEPATHGHAPNQEHQNSWLLAARKRRAAASLGVCSPSFLMSSMSCV
jgi:hypothetical protein